MAKLPPDEIRRRKIELRERYAGPIWSIIALMLCKITDKETIDKLAFSALKRVIRTVRVNPWPPTKETDEEVDKIVKSIIRKYLDSEK